MHLQQKQGWKGFQPEAAAHKAGYCTWTYIEVLEKYEKLLEKYVKVRLQNNEWSEMDRKIGRTNKNKNKKKV